MWKLQFRHWFDIGTYLASVYIEIYYAYNSTVLNSEWLEQVWQLTAAKQLGWKVRLFIYFFSDDG